jgi:hypothetical protein
MSAWKKVACANGGKWTACRSHVAAHHKGVHDADGWEDGWERTYADTTECWSADADAKGWAVDGNVLLLYDDLGAACACAWVMWLGSWAAVDRGWWRFAVDVWVVTDVGEPGLTYWGASSHR